MMKLELSKKTEKRLKKLISLHQNDESFFNRIIDAQIDELKRSVLSIKNDLKEFEKKYNKDSQLFYKEFMEGELGDNNDYMIWSGIYEMYLRDKEKLDKLQ